MPDPAAWQHWLVENLLRGVEPPTLVARLVAEGVGEAAVQRTLEELPGAPGFDVSEGNEADPLAMFTFAVGEHAGETAGARLDAAAAVFDPTRRAAWGGTSDERGRAFRFAREALTRQDRASLQAGRDEGRITLEVDPNAPATLYLYVFDQPRLFAPGLAEIKARVQDLQDPAGNAIASGMADQNQVVGPF